MKKSFKISTRMFALGVLMLAFIFHSYSTFAQSPRLTLDEKGISLKQAIEKVEKVSGYNFLYNAQLVDVNRKVSISVKNVDIKVLLHELFKGTNISFRIVDRQIVLSPKGVAAGEDDAVAETKSPSSSNGKGKRDIKGSVFDEQGVAIPGASVMVKGTSIGTATNIDGHFNLGVPSEQSRIVVSFIGYTPVELALGKESSFKVVLKLDAKRIDEVVVTGFGTISKERSTGSVAVLKSDELSKKVDVNLSSTLEGKVAGLSSYKGNSVIRGITSFVSNSTPLVVVDGLPIEGTLNDVNVLDVESVTVLKDAAAASIYGTRAGNGVFVVTTKSGKKGDAVIDLSSNFYIAPKPRVSDFRYASTSEIVDFERSFLENDPAYKSNPLKFFTDKDDYQTSYSLLYDIYYKQLSGLITAEEKEAQIAQLKKYDYRKEFEKYVWQNSLTQQHNIAFRKGADKMDVAFSVSYKKQKYSTINTNSDNVVVNFKNSIELCRWLNVTVGAYGSFLKYKGGLGGRGATSFMPYERLIDDNGERNEIVTVNYKQNDYIKGIKGLYGLGFNPLDEMELSYKKNDNQMLRAFTEMDFKILKGLTYNFKFQYQSANNETSSTFLKDSHEMRNKIDKFANVSGNTITYLVPNNGRLNSITNKNYNYTLRNQITYNTNILKDLSLSAFTGTEFRESNETGLMTDIYGYDPDFALSGQPVDWDVLRKGVYGALYPKSRYSLYPNQSSSYVLNREFSLYANGSLSYAGKYVLAGSWRVDQTNLFGVAPENKFRPLWSISGSWNASEEPFLKKIDWLNTLKLRASWGINGNVDRSTSPYMLASFDVSSDVNAQSASIDTPPNPNLRWEKTEILNAGIDFGAFGNKLYGALDFYNKFTSDLIAYKDLDPSTGFVSAKYNNGEMLNRGVEVSLNYSWLDSKRFNATTSFVFAYNQNEVKKVSQNASSALNLIYYPRSNYRVGYPYNSIYAYRYAGITVNGDPSVYDKNGNVVENTGSMNDAEALVYMGKYDPTTSGSVSQSFSYNGFTLDALFVFYAGHKLRLDVLPLYNEVSASMMQGLSDRWSPTNKDSDIPKFPVYGSTGDRADYWKYADKHVVSASMVKLRSVGLGYRFNKEFLKKVNMKGAQIKAQVNNPWYWAACGNGIDPENYNAQEASRYGANRPVYIFSLNLTF